VILILKRREYDLSMCYDVSMCLLSYDFLFDFPLIIPKLIFVTPYTYTYFEFSTTLYRSPLPHSLSTISFIFLAATFPFIFSCKKLHLRFFQMINCQIWLHVGDWLHFQFSCRFFSQSNRILRFQFLEFFFLLLLSSQSN
jgi:hypothetical protein